MNASLQAGGPPHPRFRRISLGSTLLLAGGLMLGSTLSFGAEDTSNEKAVDRATFSLKYPTTWKEDVKASDYKPESNFTLTSAKNSYIQFNIVDKADDPQKVLDNAVFNLDGLAITTLSKTKIDEWGSHKGAGLHLKGKILGTDPGGIRCFVFNSEHHNVLVIEFYFSNELKTVQSEMDFISKNFQMKE
jgi:hypothetical protein